MSKAATGDSVNRPAHYIGQGLEVIEIIEAWRLGFHLGNAVKYLLRAGKKGDRLEDLRKARWYLERARRRASEVALLVRAPIDHTNVQTLWPWPNIGDIQDAFGSPHEIVEVVCAIGWMARTSAVQHAVWLDHALTRIDGVIEAEVATRDVMQRLKPRGKAG